MKKKNDSITLPLETFEDFLWMSYRYCIGRSTIAAHYHANVVAKALSNFSEERQIHNANDIMQEVNDTLHLSGWSNNVYGKHQLCVLNLCLQHIEENDLWKHFDELNFDIDIDYKTKKIVVSHNILKNPNQYRHTITDLLIWNDVANTYLKENHKIAVMDIDGETKEIEVYESWTEVYGMIDGTTRFKKCYKSVESGKNGNMDWYLNEDNLKEIKDI